MLAMENCRHRHVPAKSMISVKKLPLGVFSCSRSQRKARNLRMEFDEMHGVIQSSERASKVSGRKMVQRIDSI